MRVTIVYARALRVMHLDGAELRLYPFSELDGDLYGAVCTVASAAGDEV